MTTTRDDSAPRFFVPALAVVSLVGLALRLLALTGHGGPLAAPSDYDDGVYFSASALLLRGVLPYRDFVFVHPPGVLYFFAVTSWWPSPAQAFAAARILATLAGAANVFLLGRVVQRGGGAFAGLVAAAFYATYPEAIVVERSAYLEPVLNLSCLLSAFFWLRARSRAHVAGALCGVACAVKFWGGIWLLATLASTERGRRWSDTRRFVVAAAIAGLALVAPLALPAPFRFLEQTLRFQLSRPPDGTLEKAARLHEMFGGTHTVASVLAVLAIVALLARLRMSSREERYFAVAAIITSLGFLASSSYWNQYNSHLALSHCALAGLGAAALVRLVTPPLRAYAAIIVTIALVIAQRHGVAHAWRVAHEQTADLVNVARAIRRVVPPSQTVFAFDPTWTLAGNRLPPHDDGAPVVVDSYGAMLMTAAHGGRRHPDTASAFQSGVAQPEVRARLERSRFLILGWRGNWQLGEDDRKWVASNFLCVTPEAGELCVAERTDRPLPPQLAIAPRPVAFGDGWYGEEGAPPWRWMSGRSMTTLPPVDGAARLQLDFYVQLDAVGEPPHIGIAIDDRPLGTLTGSASEVHASFDVDVRDGATHTLVITTDRTFVPAKLGNSTDTRELGLSLKRLIWLPLTQWPAASARGRAAAASTSSPR